MQRMLMDRAAIIGVTIAFIAGAVALEGCSGIRMERTLRQHEGDWPTFGGSSTRSGQADRPIVPPLKRMWELDVTAGIGNGSPLMVDSTVIVGNLRGELYVANGRTGKRIGWVKLGEAIQGSPVANGSIVYVAVSNSNESLLAVDLRTGKTQWKQDFGDVEVSPLFLNQRLYIGNLQGQVICVDPSQGQLIWKYEIPDNKLHNGFRSSPSGLANTIVVGGEDGTVYAFDAEKGTVRWTYKTGSYIAATPSISDSLVYVGNLAGSLYALELGSGRLRWHYDSDAPIRGSASVGGNAVYFGNLTGSLYALNAGSGGRLWQDTLEGPINSGPAITGDYLYIGTLKKFVFAVRISDGAIVWKQELEGRIKTSPAAVNGQLLVATDDWSIVAFRGSSQ